MAEILIVDDDVKFLDVLTRLLTGRGHETTALEDGESALAAVAAKRYDLIISDIFMKPVSGLDFLTRIKAEHSDVPVILLTAYATVESALDALKMGAFDYITKPFKIDDLMQTIEEALNADPKQRDDSGAPPHVQCVIGPIVAESESMREVCMMIERVAPTDVTVLFRGEKGVGKQLCGRAIHELSPRAEAPFVVAECRDQTDDELVLQLFGQAGDETQQGCFLEAQGGTLWLSEIGHLSMDFQEVLSGVFKNRTIYQAGGDEAIPVDVRILAETSEDIQVALAERRFRPDLFARFAPIAVEIKPLRERREDILPLAHHIIQLEDPAIRLQKDTQAALLHYPWPGNITELEAVITGALKRCSEKVITREDIPEVIRRAASDAGDTPVAATGQARALKAFLRSKAVDPESVLSGGST